MVLQFTKFQPSVNIYFHCLWLINKKLNVFVGCCHFSHTSAQTRSNPARKFRAVFLVVRRDRPKMLDFTVEMLDEIALAIEREGAVAFHFSI
jgi:hypothetical protein